MTRQEKAAASVAETEEEAAAASMEPTPTPEEGFQARRLSAIKAKAVEIEKVFTFVPPKEQLLLNLLLIALPDRKHCPLVTLAVDL